MSKIIINTTQTGMLRDVNNWHGNRFSHEEILEGDTGTVHVWEPDDFEEMVELMEGTETECFHSIILLNYFDWTNGMSRRFDTYLAEEYSPLKVFAVTR